jgi:hypothetical protein
MQCCVLEMGKDRVPVVTGSVTHVLGARPRTHLAQCWLTVAAIHSSAVIQSR